MHIPISILYVYIHNTYIYIYVQYIYEGYINIYLYKYIKPTHTRTHIYSSMKKHTKQYEGARYIAE
jgi:hypothetical protein